MNAASQPTTAAEGLDPGGRRRGLRWWHIPLLAYALALVASWFVMTVERAPGPLPAGATEMASPAFDGAGQRVDGSESVRLVYRETGAPSGPAILLLHGSPGALHDFRSIAPELADRFRLIAVDLPGFGASTLDPPSVSVRAHAAYCESLLDALGIESAHVVGFSMGGAVALELVDQAPARVRSITMLAALGVEELELLGDHTLNHGLHGLQLAFFHAVRWLTPHFGAFDKAMLGIPYARNFYDTDQRRLRPILESLEAPMLVLHGENDFLIPVDAAKEHARIVPQAELFVFPAPLGHFIPWQEAPAVAQKVRHFVNRVDADQAVTRRSAPPERVVAAGHPFDASSLPPFEGPALLTVLLLLALATFVSEDLACIGAGLLVADGRVGFLAASAACFFGILVGDVGLYLIGRALGRPALRRRPLSLFISEAAVDRASAWFQAKGIGVIFLSRFTPGLRLPTYVAAGVLRTRFLAFVAFFAVAGILWTPALVGIAALAGEQLAAAIGGLGAKQLPVVVLFVVLMLQVYRSIPLLFTHRGRRVLRGRWRRLVGWEFRSPLIAYLPLMPWIAWLGIKHRGLTKVTAANPAMPAGGFIGESKAAILDGLGAGEVPEVAPYVLLRADDSADAREAAAVAFARSVGDDYPLFLKPNEGERGFGVGPLEDEPALRTSARAVHRDAVLQRRVDGDEFGVFYTRHPAEDRGSIFAITIKLLPTVTGDARRTVEELLLDDPRACALHARYLIELGAQATRVPRAGEEVRLVEVGTHSRGAVFLDGASLITPELEAAVERIARGYEGFYFGRFDIRAPSAAHLSRGEGLGVIELNGVTSEATHVYDPKVSLVEAYRTWARQWARAYEIGSANAALGAPTTSLVGLLGAWWRARRTRRQEPACPLPDGPIPATPHRISTES